MTTFPRRRIRRVLKWGGLGLSMAIAMAWGLSLHWHFYYSRGRAYMTLPEGYVQFRRYYQGPLNPQGLFLARIGHRPPSDCIPDTSWWNIDITQFELHVRLSLRMLLLLAAIPTALLFWLDRGRIPPGHCQRCGYDLTGNVSGVCSECGTPVPENRPGR